MAVHVLAGCFVAWWVCYVCAPGMCGGRCGVARWCSGKFAVWRGCGVWSLACGRLGLRFRPRVRFGLLLVTGTELVCGLWGFWRWCRCRSCAGRLRCPMSLGSASWCIAMSRAGLSGEVRVGGVGDCGVVWWRWVVCWFPHFRGGGVSCPSPVGWVAARGWSSAGAGLSHAVSWPSLWCSPVRGRCGIVAARGSGSPGVGFPGLECPNQGGFARVVPGCVSPPLSGSRGVGSAVYEPGTGCHVYRVRACGGPGSAPVGVERLCVARCIVPMVGGGGYRLVAGAGASLWMGPPWCLLGVPRGGPWSAACGGLLRCTASMGAPLCVGGPPWGMRGVVGAWLVSVSSVWSAAVRRVLSSAVPLGGLLWWSAGGGLGLGGSWWGAGHAGSGWRGAGARVWACTAIFRFWGCPVPGVSALCSLRGFLLPPSPSPLFLLFRFFFGGGGVWFWYGVYSAERARGCVPVLVLVWMWVLLRKVDGRPLRSGCPVCVSALGHLVAFGFRGTGQGGAGGGRSAALVVWCLFGWSWLSGSARVAWPDAGVRVGVFLARDVWVACIPLFGAGRLALAGDALVVSWCPAWVVVQALVGVCRMGLGVGYACAEGLVDWAGALWVMQRVVKKLSMPIKRMLSVPRWVPVPLVMLAGVFQVLRRAMVRLALPMVWVLQAV